MATAKLVIVSLAIVVMVGYSVGGHDRSCDSDDEDCIRPPRRTTTRRPTTRRPTTTRRPWTPQPPRTGLPCRTGNDCGRRECCLEPGTCQPLGGVSAWCDTRQPYQWRKPVAMIRGFRMCPCSPGNFCASIGRGSTRGICSFGK